MEKDAQFFDISVAKSFSSISTKAEWENAVDLYNAFVRKRIDANLLGYEQGLDFSEGFKRFIQNGIGSISDNYPSASEDIVINAGLEALAQKSLSLNSQEFDRFHNTHLKDDPAFSNKSKEEILTAIGLVAYTTYQINPETWRAGWRFTFVFPFCIPPGPF